MNDTTIIYFLSLCIVFLVGIVLYQQIIFRSGFLSKIREISGKLKEITDTDSGERIMVFTGNKELMELAAQINQMLENHRKVNVDYDRSKNAYKKMLSNVSHDIKTPMTVVLGYLEIMRIHGTGTDEMLRKTEEKANGVMELIDQFFTLAKIESGDMDTERSKLDICEICRENILDFYEILTNNEFQVVVHVPEVPLYALGNKNALKRILTNLISNVIRYGADGKYFGLYARSDERFVYIDIIDKGKGIDKLFADSVFERLFTMEDSRNRSIQGNGLGLTIAKDLALQLGGDITLESVPYEKTIFTVKLKKVLY